MGSLTRTFNLARICAANSRVPKICRANYGDKVKVEYSGGLKALKRNQAKFQCDDGLPVFLKGGAMDKILYQTTWVLIFVGFGLTGKLFWDLAKPRWPEE